VADEEARAGGHPGRAAVDAAGRVQVNVICSGWGDRAGDLEPYRAAGVLTVRVPLIVQPVSFGWM
jgi:hypothetical protein